MSKQFESHTVSLTPNGTMGFIDFEGEALINEIYKWPDGGGIVEGTHSKGVLSDSRILKATISMITDYHAELRLRLLASLNR